MARLSFKTLSLSLPGLVAAGSAWAHSGHPALAPVHFHAQDAGILAALAVVGFIALRLARRRF